MNFQFDFDTRTAGTGAQPIKSVQAWKTKTVAQIEPAAGLKAVDNQTPIQEKFTTALCQSDEELRTAYAPTGDEAIRRDGKEPYAFKDIIDIVNPLHHLPVVGMVYRELTGDEIKPASQIIGGSIYGGPVGAVTGTVNAIAQMETGKDVAGNVLALAGIGTDTKDVPPNLKDNPEARLNAIASLLEDQAPTELPGTAIAFANLSEAGKSYIKTDIASGRSAGSTLITKQQIATYDPYANNSAIASINLDQSLPGRETITQLSMPAMPSRQNN